VSTPEPHPAGRPGSETPKLRPVDTPPVAHVTWRSIADALTGWVAEELRHPRIRLAVIGVALLLIGAFGLISSVWTLPLVIVGALMVLIAWIGSRLDGRFAVEWGETGTQLEFRARIKAPPIVEPSALPAAPAAAATPGLWLPRQAAPEDPNVVEGSAHTVEIDVSELKALIAAAEVEDPANVVASRSEAGSPADVDADSRNGRRPSSASSPTSSCSAACSRST
jgi:hypothetical protein